VYTICDKDLTQRSGFGAVYKFSYLLTHLLTYLQGTLLVMSASHEQGYSGEDEWKDDAPYFSREGMHY